MVFEFATAGNIVFGVDAVGKLPGILSSYSAKSALVVTGKNKERAKPALEAVEALGIQKTIVSIPGEPKVSEVTDAVRTARGADVDLVIAFGGGSVVDAGKAVAALLANGGEPIDYMEVIGAGKKLTKPSLPFIAIPTTAGTGAEVTKNAVIDSPEHSVKCSLRSPFMLPNVAIIDPRLTVKCPPAITAACGLDAFTQCIEPYTSHLANPLSDAVARQGIVSARDGLLAAFKDGANLEAREKMAVTSLCGGIALANAKLGAVHGFAGVLGGMFHGPHGAIVGVLLPHVMRINVIALRARDPSNPALEKFTEIARILTADAAAKAEDGCTWVETLCKELKIPGLSSYGMTESDFNVVVEKSAKASSMQGNPIKLTEEELGECLRLAL